MQSKGILFDDRVTLLSLARSREKNVFDVLSPSRPRSSGENKGSGVCVETRGTFQCVVIAPLLSLHSQEDCVCEVDNAFLASSIERLASSL
ncbi:hypothetical protein R1flu_004147 [Riccia fluitans]|uniref:Uncharacterized protein n=1 Tax=Riccia fluitans TaxID=41844 RepID=A0ABD1YPR0_9MARC